MENKTKVNHSVVYWKDGRYAIVDETTGEIIDDAQGYGYKDKQKATKAMWWKFGGGQEKVNQNKSNFKEWIKEDSNKKVVDRINELVEINWKEIARNETTIKELIQEVENEFSIKIPNFVVKSMFK